MAELMPVLMHSAPNTKIDEANPPMSPLQAIFIMGLLIDQKVGDPDYQVAPAEWDRDVYPRLLAQLQQRQEVKRRAQLLVRLGEKYIIEEQGDGCHRCRDAANAKRLPLARG
jgi:hypothetical protein